MKGIEKKAEKLMGIGLGKIYLRFRWTVSAFVGAYTLFLRKLFVQETSFLILLILNCLSKAIK